MAKVYENTWWGSICDVTNNWGKIYKPLANCFNSKAVQFDGVSPGESISISDIGYQFLENEGMLIMAWVKLDPALKTFSNYGQRCIVDYSSNIFNTPTAKGYSIYVRKTTTTLTINWYYKRVGLSRTQCNIDIDLNLFDFSKPMLLVASLYPDNVGGVSSTVQDFRIWQNGVNANDYVDGTQNVIQVLGSTFPPTQNVCLGATNDTGSTTSAELAGIIDEVVFYSGSVSIGEDYRQLRDDYFRGNGGEPQLDLSQLPFYSGIRGWYRMGDNLTITSPFTFPNASGGSGASGIGDSDFSADQIVSSII